MKVKKCDCCGARLKYDKASNSYKCPYCGAIYSLEGSLNKVENNSDLLNDKVKEKSKDTIKKETNTIDDSEYNSTFGKFVKIAIVIVMIIVVIVFIKMAFRF